MAWPFNHVLKVAERGGPAVSALNSVRKPVEVT